MRAIIERIKNEPAVLTAVILGIANLFGQDWTSYIDVLESVIIVAASFVLRKFVTPVRKLDAQTVRNLNR